MYVKKMSRPAISTIRICEVTTQDYPLCRKKNFYETPVQLSCNFDVHCASNQKYGVENTYRTKNGIFQ